MYQESSRTVSTITQLLPMIGVILGAVLQYLFSRVSEQRKQQQTLKTQAYADFLRGVSGVATAQKGARETESDFMTVLTDAKARIAVYGSGEVVAAIADFWRGVPVLNSPGRYRSFVKICQAMRRDSLPNKQRVLDKDISQLLFSEDV